MSFNRLGALFGQDLAHPRYTATIKPLPPLGVSDWRIALNYRCTNSKKLQSRSASPHLEAGAGSSVGRKRGRPWSDDATEWPAKRLTVAPPPARLAREGHDVLRLPALQPQELVVHQDAAAGEGKRFAWRGGGGRQVSPVGIKGLSSAESTDARPGRTKLFCMTRAWIGGAKD